MAETPALPLPQELARFLSGSTPRVLLVKGAPGAGKSSLLRAIAPHLAGETAFIAYRANPSAPSSGAPDPAAREFTLVLMQRRTAPGGPPPTPSGDDRTPAALRDAYARIRAGGGGCLIIDSWDRGSEETFREIAHGEVDVAEVTVTGRALRELLQRIPLHALVAITTSPDEQFDTESDGIVELGTEEIDGTPIRVVRVSKLRGHTPVGARRPYTLEGGTFYAAPERGPGFLAPFGAPDDPPGDGELIWPGSEEFARAFGGLRPHGITGVDLTDDVPDRLFEVLAFPIVAGALRAGAHVVWIPPGSAPPASVVHALAPLVPAENLNAGLRILSASGYDPDLARNSPVLLPIRRAAGGTREIRSADAAPVAPLFQDAHQFLAQTPAGKPALLVVSIDGLRALASVSSATYDPATFPLIAAAYVQLPRSHAIGFGRVGDPLTVAALPSVDLHIRLRLVHAHPVAFGLRPRTPAYLMDWKEDGRLRLRPIV